MTEYFSSLEVGGDVDADVDAEPKAAVPRGWTVRFSLLWFGFWMANLVPIQLLLPNQLNVIDPAHKIRDFGVINGVAGLAALITLPLFGALCDRTRSPLGRRRVWTIAGTGVFTIGLLLTGTQNNWIALGATWLLATLGINMATSGLTATTADEVPDHQRGAISSAIYGPQALGLLLGLVVVTSIHNSGEIAYGFLAAALVGCVWPFLRYYRDPPLGDLLPVDRLTLRGIALGMWISPRRHPDFAWGFGGRLLVNIGNALGTTYLLFFLQDDLELADPDAGLLILTLIYVAFTLVTTYAGGYLSDRTGRRRVFVLIASLLQALACVLLTFFPSFGVAMVGAALLGAGYGAFMSVDQALITRVLPDARSRAKDLGIMNVGSVGPQALAPLTASLIISSLGGYPVLFASAGLTTLGGAAMIYRIKSVP